MSEDNVNERLESLANDGITIDPLMLLKARLDLITEIFRIALGIEEEYIDEAWNNFIGRVLDAAEQQVADADDTPSEQHDG